MLFWILRISCWDLECGACARHNYFSAGTIKSNSGSDLYPPDLVGGLYVESTYDTVPTDQSIQKPSLAVRVILLQFEVDDVEEFAVEVTVPNKRLYSGAMFHIMRIGLHNISLLFLLQSFKFSPSRLLPRRNAKEPANLMPALPSWPRGVGPD